MRSWKRDLTGGCICSGTCRSRDVKTRTPITSTEEIKIYFRCYYMGGAFDETGIPPRGDLHAFFSKQFDKKNLSKTGKKLSDRT
jgi:hypothetical protein